MTTIQNSPSPDELPHGQPPHRSPRFQFGLRTLFWITTATAVLCALLFTMPSIIAIPVMLFITAAVQAAVWTTVIIYGRGYQRTFGIGAMFPSAIVLVHGAIMVLFGSSSAMWDRPDDNGIAYRLMLLGFWVSSFLVGAICMSVRRFLEKRQPATPS